jgi:hypothetical protein
MASGARPVVFLGPTLPVAEARRVLDADYLPPAAQGSVVRAVLRRRPCAILIIDGTFQGEPAVRHKEIMWALAEGIPVWGAASMGALRAAELGGYGMAGVGLVFRWYRAHAFAPDDAVAVLHGPAELGWPALTDALVDLRMTFRRAERAGRIDAALRSRLDATAAGLNFRERSLDAVVARVGDRSRDRLARILRDCWVPQKKLDALQALRLLDAGGAWRPTARRRFVVTNAFLRDLDHAGIALPREGDRA